MDNQHTKQILADGRSYWQLNRRGFLSAGVGSIFAASLTAAEGPHHAEKTVASDHVRLGLRVWRPIWADKAVFARLLKTLRTFPQAIDELALFDEFVHVLGKPLKEVEHESGQMADRLRQTRDAGIDGAGINVIATLGHGIQGDVDEPLFPPIVNHEGKVRSACSCPRSPELWEYLASYLRLMASAGPDVIWIDDDYRTVTGGVRYACFCERCMNEFGQGTDREALVVRLDDPDEGDLRRAWSSFYAQALIDLAAHMRRAIRDVDPKIEIGLMTVGYSVGTYADYPITRLMQSLDATRGRPGHGYYHDDRPRAILDKTIDVGRQVRDYPPRVQWCSMNWRTGRMRLLRSQLRPSSMNARWP